MTRLPIALAGAAACLLALPAAQAATLSKADYKVAAEKCESLSGDARSACMATARSRFGKT